VSRGRFETAYHPYACRLIELLNRAGLKSLFDPVVQQLRRRPVPRKTTIRCRPVVRPLPSERHRLQPCGRLRGSTNWELFFHVPMLIAERLIANQKFADGFRWLHAVFNPTESPGGPSAGTILETAPLR